jgi:hypothetical protein
MGNALNCWSASESASTSIGDQKLKLDGSSKHENECHISKEFTEEILRSDETINSATSLRFESNTCCSSSVSLGISADSARFANISYLLQSRGIPVKDELGAIQYLHNKIVNAKDHAKECGLPILCVEAEAPGDIDAGNEVLSHPLVVESAETLFVTVAPIIESKNNCNRYRPSKERKAWYTTISFLDKDGNELVPCIGGDQLCTAVLVESMIKSLRLLDLTVPSYLEILREEESGKQMVLPNGVVKRIDRQAMFGVEDHATGEVELGGLDGVLQTEAGCFEGQRVIRVAYDSKSLSYGKLLQFALSQKVGNVIYYQSQDERVAIQMETSRMYEKPEAVKLDEQARFCPIHDSKSALRKTEMRYVPLTDLQAMRANRLIHMGSFNKATHLLSPRQGVILMKCYNKVSERSATEVVHVPIKKAWKCVENRNSSSGFMATQAEPVGP